MKLALRAGLRKRYALSQCVLMLLKQDFAWKIHAETLPWNSLIKKHVLAHYCSNIDTFNVTCDSLSWTFMVLLKCWSDVGVNCHAWWCHIMWIHTVDAWCRLSTEIVKNMSLTLFSRTTWVGGITSAWCCTGSIVLSLMVSVGQYVMAATSIHLRYIEFVSYISVASAAVVLDIFESQLLYCWLTIKYGLHIQ